MTQLELDELMNAENLDELVNNDNSFDMNVDREVNNVDMVQQLNSVTVDSEKKATEIMTQLDRVLVEIEAVVTCIKNDEKEKAFIICDDIKNIVFDTMSMMQYQDIHRQKIERVINKMVEISNMMNSTLSSVTTNIAPSAKHIDKEDGDSVSEDELAELIAKMGNN